MKPTEITLHPVDNLRLANLCGVLDENIRQIEDRLRRDDRPPRRAFQRCTAKLRPTGAAWRAFLRRSGRWRCRWMTSNSASSGSPTCTPGPSPAPVLLTRKAELHGRTPRQVDYLRRSGARHHLRRRPGRHRQDLSGGGQRGRCLRARARGRIILTRPAVEAGERLGFLPGDLAQKVDPYLRPLYDALYDLMGFDRVTKLFERGCIEIAPLAFMRGRTQSRLHHPRRAQNTSPEQMKMFLTRIGIGSRAVITGDLTQVDLPRGQKSGLGEAVQVLADVRGVAFTRFLKETWCVTLVARIVAAYEAHSQRNPGSRPSNDRTNQAPRRLDLSVQYACNREGVPCRADFRRWLRADDSNRWRGAHPVRIVDDGRRARTQPRLPRQARIAPPTCSPLQVRRGAVGHAAAREPHPACR